MTKEEFLEGIKDAVEDMTDPRGDWADFITEGEELRVELAVHDPILGQKISAILTSIQDFGDYLKVRGEQAKAG